MGNGIFITLEGGEGAGKSSLLDYLYQYLQERGHKVIKTREPGGTLLGKDIRRWLLNAEDTYSLFDQTEMLLFLADRSQHIEELIKPALENGFIVLCDRFNDSTIAYQGARGSLDRTKVMEFCYLVCNNTLPHLTLFLDVEPTIGLLRTLKCDKEISVSGELDRMEKEKLSFHEEVRRNFYWLMEQEPQRVKLINANKNQEDVQSQALSLIQNFILEFPKD